MKKKNLLIVLLLCMFCFIGGVLAYFTNTATIDNIFKTKPYSTKVEEKFESPENWTPGTTTNKTVTVENTGEVDVAVRVKLEGKWESSNKKVLDGKILGEEVAVLNFAPDYTTNWELKEDGYYYYKTNLSPAAKTKNLLESVTFNSKAVASNNCTTSTDEGTHTTTTTCASTGDGYDGATYTLKVTIETVQADAKEDLWGN